MSGSEPHSNRSISNDSSVARTPETLSPPSQVHHPSIVPIPTSGFVESVAGAAHYSGVRLDHETGLHRRKSSGGTAEVHTELKPSHRVVLDDLRELYACRPTVEIFERSWNKDAVFEDPLLKCKGYKEYAAKFFAMPKFFSHLTTDSIRIMSSTHSPNRLVFAQKQTYTIRRLKRKKTIDSIITVDLDDDEKIIRLVDQWNGEHLPTRYGAEYLRLLSAKVTPWLISVPKLHGG